MIPYAVIPCPSCGAPTGHLAKCPCAVHRRFIDLMARDPVTWGPKIRAIAERTPDPGLAPKTGPVPVIVRAVTPGKGRQRAQAARGGPCAYLGAPILDPSGNRVLRPCRTCGGQVMLKVFACNHPGHAADPTATDSACRLCRDYRSALEIPHPVPADRTTGQPSPSDLESSTMSAPAPVSTLPVKMVMPSDHRPGIWRNGVIQIQVTRACDLSCCHCTQGSNLGGKPAMMSVDQFDQACASLKGYFGVVGMFGGNPCLHPRFGDLCAIMRARFPFQQRGLWSNNLNGHGKHAAITFNPRHSNINVHLSSTAAEEFRRDWPEATPYIKGEADDSEHGSPWVALRDVIDDEAERWRLIQDCDINKYWSALIGVVGKELRAFFCEIAYAQAALHYDNPDWLGTGAPMPDTGLAVTPGWWQLPQADFADQITTHCHACGIPMRRPGQMAIGGDVEEFSETHRYIARPKRDRAVEIVQIGGTIERREKPSTEYLAGTTPR